jgi:hypothetical protein
MITVSEIPIISVQIKHYGHGGITAVEDVDFKIYREGAKLKAIPLLSKEERLTTQLPEELEFVYANHCIAEVNNTGEESLDAIKQIIQELEVKELL